MKLLLLFRTERSLKTAIQVDFDLACAAALPKESIAFSGLHRIITHSTRTMNLEMCHVFPFLGNLCFLLPCRRPASQIKDSNGDGNERIVNHYGEQEENEFGCIE